MKILITKINQYGSDVVVALVDSAFSQEGAGDTLMQRIAPHYPGRPVMLVSLEENGYRAHAHFQTHMILMALQREQLRFEEVDLDQPLPEEELPF